MGATQTDVDLALFHSKQMEERIDRQREMIARHKAQGLSTDPEEAQLAALWRALEIIKAHLGNLTVGEQSSEGKVVRMPRWRGRT